MDPKRFDRIARALGAAKLGRRNLAGSVLGVAGLAAVYRLVVAQPACAGDGQSCTIMSGCCDGFVCNVSLMNPNFGTCRAGDDVLGTGWTFAGMPAPVATEIARERARRRKKGRNKNRNANKRARATATPTPTATATVAPTATVDPNQTPTPDPGDGPTPVPTAGPDVTPPPNDQSVDLAIDIDPRFAVEVTKFKNKGATNLRVTVIKTKMGCFYPNLDVPVGTTRELKTGEGQAISRMYFDINDKADTQVSYESAPGVVGYVAFRGYCDGSASSRLQSPVITCR